MQVEQCSVYYPEHCSGWIAARLGPRRVYAWSIAAFTYASKVYSAASFTTFAISATVFGAMILMPLYYQVIRNQDPVMTGLLVALAGGLISAVATIPFTLIGSATSLLVAGRVDGGPRHRHRALHGAGRDGGVPRGPAGQDQRQHCPPLCSLPRNPAPRTRLPQRLRPLCFFSRGPGPRS